MKLSYLVVRLPLARYMSLSSRRHVFVDTHLRMHRKRRFLYISQFTNYQTSLPL